MIKKYKDYILLLIIFLLFIFSGSINRFLIAINPNLDTKNIELNYDKYLKDELDNIKKINNIEFNDDLDLQVSRVKYRNVYEYSDTLTIYKGFKNNVFVNDIVLNNDGLIGIVTKTYDYYSIVTLITNKNSNISVKINDAIGILKTINNTLVVTNINNYEKVNVDDEIYTSGLGNLPDNIYIGKVKSINLNNTEIEKVVEVNINDRLEKLDYVFNLTFMWIYKNRLNYNIYCFIP
jgi:rod shape-determining protein MreC